MNRILYRAAHTAAARKAMLTKIIRAGHAGEIGAVRLYAGQMAVLGRSSLRSVIQEMHDQEREHLDAMEKLSAQYNIPHSIFASTFRIVSYVLGVATGLLGKKGAMACTVAVEELVAQHYTAQVKELMNDDPEVHKELMKILTKLRDEELHHRDIGVKYNGLEVPLYNLLKFVVQAGLKGAVYISERF